jgi:hypothetical protein
VKRLDPEYAMVDAGKAQQTRQFYVSFYNLPELLRYVNGARNLATLHLNLL